MKRDLELLYEVGALRLMPRQWSRFLTPDFANLADHHFRVIWLALVIAAREGAGDTGKIIKMALMHDIAESRTGDVDYLARQYVERNETKAFADMLEGTSLEKEFIELYKEYEQRKSIESRIVKDADNLDVDLELREQGARGNVLGRELKGQREWVGNTRFYTKAGKQLHKEVWQSNPHDWHVKSPHNRLNGGDWKEADET
jgi:putative hydrolase of HD superfamily